MPDVILAGCRTTPLAGYLAALGVLRAVTRTLDPDAAGFWQAQRFVLRSRLADVDELADALQQHFEPEAIVSPWSEGAGLREKPSNRSAATAVEWLRKSSEPRLRTLRDAVLAGDRVIDRGLANGWGGTGSNLWDKKFKPELLRLCRNELPDGALAWLDTAATLGQGADPSYSRLLGTGGNFGRQDLSATYLSRVRHVFEDRRSTPWLAAVLGGAETVPWAKTRWPCPRAGCECGTARAWVCSAASGSSAALADVFAAIGDCQLRHGTGLFDEFAPALGEDAELRVALALATARDEPTRDAPHTKTMHGLRPLLSPVIVGHRSAPTWSNRAVPASLGAGLPRALAAAARLRSQPRPADAPADGEAQPAIRGARIAYQHGTSLRSGDVADFLGGKLDEQRLTALLSGLLTVDWHGLPDVRLPGQIEHDPVLDLLLPFAGVDALTYPLPDGDRAALLLRPGRSWPALLSAERGGEVLADAVRRLKLGGVAHVITPRQRLPAGDRLAALLLFRTSPGDRLSMLRRIADLPQARKTMEEITP